MGVKDKKAKIFGKIAAQKTLADGFPEINLTESMPSLNNGNRSMDFLVDLIKVLKGAESLLKTVIDVIVNKSEDLDNKIKNALKLALKNVINCSIDPSIPDFLKNPVIDPFSDGVKLRLNDFDFSKILKINPTSDLGNQIYGDRFNGLNSTDFNTFLYSTIQEEGSLKNWGGQTSNNDILSIVFDSITSDDTNIIKVYTSEQYSNKKITDLNNDYIDSINIIDPKLLIATIIENLFGTISSTNNKTSEELLTEAKIEQLIDKFLNLEDDKVIDDSFFVFSNEEINELQNISLNKSQGILKLQTCGNVSTSINTNTVNNVILEYEATSELVDKRIVLERGIDSIANEASNVDGISEKDKYNIKLNIIERIIKVLSLIISRTLLSPKILIILMVNIQILTNNQQVTSNPFDFIKNNRLLFKLVIETIKNYILNAILEEVLKEIEALIKKNATGLVSELASNNQSQLLSLLGVPQDVIRIIRNI